MLAGRGDSTLRMFLMEISLKLWKQDRASKEAKLLANEQADPIQSDGGSGIQYGDGVTYSH